MCAHKQNFLKIKLGGVCHRMYEQSIEKPLQTLFKQCENSSWFAQLQSRVKVMQSLQELFDQECPLELMGQCRVLEINEKFLLIAVSNASQATQLQYRTRELVAALKKYPAFAGVKKIKVKVATLL